MYTTHLRPLSFGEILDGAFSLYRRHFVTLFATALLPLVPTSIGIAVISRSLSLVEANQGAPGMGSMILAGALIVVGMPGAIVMWAALTAQVGEAWTGGEPSVGEGYRRGGRRFFALIGAGILAYTVVVAAMMIAGLAAALVGGIGIAAATGLGAGAAGALIAIPLVIAVFAVMLGVSAALFGVLPALVLEKLGPAQAITRSFRLTRGAVGRVVGVVMVTMLIVYLPVVGVLLVTGAFATLADPTAIPGTGLFWVQQLANMVTGALTTPFMVASFVILYFDRRVRTEALDVQLAADALAPG